MKSCSVGALSFRGTPFIYSNLRKREIPTRLTTCPKTRQVKAMPVGQRRKRQRKPRSEAALPAESLGVE
jgi:hypothetical protein